MNALSSRLDQVDLHPKYSIKASSLPARCQREPSAPSMDILCGFSLPVRLSLMLTESYMSQRGHLIWFLLLLRLWLFKLSDRMETMCLWGGACILYQVTKQSAGNGWAQENVSINVVSVHLQRRNCRSTRWKSVPLPFFKGDKSSQVKLSCVHFTIPFIPFEKTRRIHNKSFT